MGTKAKFTLIFTAHKRDHSHHFFTVKKAEQKRKIWSFQLNNKIIGLISQKCNVDIPHMAWWGPFPYLSMALLCVDGLGTLFFKYFIQHKKYRDTLTNKIAFENDHSWVQLNKKKQLPLYRKSIASINHLQSKSVHVKGTVSREKFSN